MKPIFPGDYAAERIGRIPGTMHDLQNNYFVLWSSQTDLLPINSTMRKRFGRVWKGEIVMIKMATRQWLNVINMGCQEFTLTDVLIDA